MTTSFYSLNYEELKVWCLKNNLRSSLASDLFNWHYKKARKEMYTHQDLSLVGKKLIQKELSFELPSIDRAVESSDKTVKFLFCLSDGKSVESVLIPFQGKYSLCVSSQVGCAMKCSFCFTGTQGFLRHLKSHEILGQYLGARRWLQDNRPTEDRILNLVYMGQGEPLNNIDEVAKSAKILIDQHGPSLAPHKITVSTAGYLPGLKRWTEVMPPVNLALSLHSTEKEKRDALIPMNKRYDLNEVMQEIERIPLKKDRFITYEYLLIKDFNDSKDDALKLGAFLKGKQAYINLIPFNPIPGSIYKRPKQSTLDSFKTWLMDFKTPVTLRKTKGDEILAACGQLKTSDKLKAVDFQSRI